MKNKMDTIFRHERKYYLENVTPRDFLNWLGYGCAVVRQHEPRWVNSIYFDSPDFQSLQDAVAGVSDRVKVRWRWYRGLAGLEDLALEIKEKHNQVVTKKTIPYRAKNTAKLGSLSDFCDQLRLPDVWKERFQLWKASVVVRYQRYYLVNFDRTVRVTVDHQVSSHPWHGGDVPQRMKAWSDTLIVELKYAPQYEDEAAMLVQSLPLTLSKSSKYVNCFWETWG